MERLTYDFCIGEKHCWQIKGADNFTCKEVCENQDGCEKCPVAEAFDRLAAYEDTMPLERAQDLAQAEKDGRLVVLPDAKYTDADGEKALRKAMWICGNTNNPVTRYTAEAIAEKLCREAKDENLPLTLKELREMDGDPVFCRSLLTGKEGWAICRIAECTGKWYLAFSGGEQAYGDKDTIGRNWIAFRRKPEDGTT